MNDLLENPPVCDVALNWAMEKLSNIISSAKLNAEIKKLQTDYLPRIAMYGDDLRERFTNEHLMDEFLSAPFSIPCRTKDEAISLLMLSDICEDVTAQQGYAAISSFYDDYLRLLEKAIPWHLRMAVALAVARLDSRPHSSTEGHDDSIRQLQLAYADKIIELVSDLERAIAEGANDQISPALHSIRSKIEGKEAPTCVSSHDRNRMREALDSLGIIAECFLGADLNGEKGNPYPFELASLLQKLKTTVMQYQLKILGEPVDEEKPIPRSLKMQFCMAEGRLTLADSSIFQLICHAFDRIAGKPSDAVVEAILPSAVEIATAIDGRGDFEETAWAAYRAEAYDDVFCKAAEIMLEDQTIETSARWETSWYQRFKDLSYITNKGCRASASEGRAVSLCAVWIGVLESCAEIFMNRCQGFLLMFSGQDYIVDAISCSTGWHFLCRLDNPSAELRHEVHLGATYYDLSSSQQVKSFYPGLYLNLAHDALKKNRKDLESAIHDGALLAPFDYSIRMH